MALTAGRYIPWSYRAGNSPLHRLPALCKLILLVALSAAPLLGLPFMAGAAALICTGAFCTGIRLRELLAGSRPLVIMLIVVVLMRSIGFSAASPASRILLKYAGITVYVNSGGLRSALVFGGGILLSFAACSLLFAVTTMMELRRSLERIELFIRRPFGGKRRRCGTISLALALMLGFLPRFFESWETARLAVSARGGSLRGRAGLRLLGIILPQVSERMIETAAETATALEARGLEL